MQSSSWAAKALTATLICFTAASCGNLDFETIQGLTNVLGSGMTAASDGQVANGLKEALRVGSERAVSSTSRSGGFLDNSALRIALPSELQTMAKGLRLVGMGQQIDELEVGMNRAAEKASAEAKPIFWNAITSMTLTDAVGILNGGNTAATEYFRDRTSASLTKSFRPVIESSMEKVGLYQDYKQLLDAYTQLPLVSKPSLDLTEHVNNAALEGLFKVLGQEETKIREDPTARTTELLKDVFGR